jgi:probable rRNA maturation factor
MTTRDRAQMRVTIQIATSRRSVPHARSLREWGSTAVLLSGYSTAHPELVEGQPTAYSLTLRIVGNAESRKLNRHWRGKDKPTNVLSFPSALTNHESRLTYMDVSNGGRAGATAIHTNHVFLGDLAICAPVVAREAREQGKTLSAHWAHMVTHGVLHLLGYDHVKTRDAKQMEAREVAILSHFGYQDPYVL